MTGDRPRGLDSRYYTDPDILAAELEHIFAHTWLLVGHRSQVDRPGRILTAIVGDESIVIANHEGAIRGFFNVCQHRGHRLIDDDHATTAPTETTTITCPYHAWTYDLGGRLIHARGEDVGEICVPPVRVDTMAGFLFVNLDGDAASLEDTVPGVEAELLEIAPDATERVLTARLTHELDANWKLAVENYNECYHCPNVHKAFTSGVVSPGSYRITPRGFAIHHTAEGPLSSRSGSKRAVGADEADAANDYGTFFTWPASSIQCYPGRALNTFRWVPKAVDRTLLIREWWFDRSEPSAEQRELIDLDWDTTVAEDILLMDSVQKGVSSRGYRPGPLIVDPRGVADVHSENSVPHIHRLLLEALGHGD